MDTFTKQVASSFLFPTFPASTELPIRVSLRYKALSIYHSYHDYYYY